MALSRPVLRNVTGDGFNATSGYTFRFDVIGGDKVYFNRLTIRDEDDYSIVYQGYDGSPTYPNYNYTHFLSANTLTNGKNYSAFVQTGGADGFGTLSPASVQIGFSTYVVPTLEFINPSSTVHNSTGTFTIKYDNEYAQNEKINFFQGFLSDGLSTIDLGTKYSYDLNEDNEYTFTVSGLLPNTTYEIWCYGQTTTKRTLIVSHTFSVSYVAPEIEGVLELENDCQNGFISITSSVEQSTVLADVASIKIKKRKKNDLEWVDVVNYEVNGSVDFSFNDITSANDTIYEYAWVPIYANGDEGYYIVKEIRSFFNGVFVGDHDEAYKFYADVQYSSTIRVQSRGIFEPYGRKYPITISNAETNYDSGTFKGRLMGSYNVTHQFNAKELTAERKSFMKFLTNKKAKIIKDTQGNFWLCMITGSPSTNYDDGTANTMMTVNFEWTEIGDADNLVDVINCGLVGGNL